MDEQIARALALEEDGAGLLNQLQDARIRRATILLRLHTTFIAARGMSDLESLKAWGHQAAQGNDELRKALKGVMQMNQQLWEKLEKVHALRSKLQGTGKEPYHPMNSRRSGPGNVPLRFTASTFLPELDAYIILEADNIINPRKPQTLAGMMQKRCLGINVIQPDGERSYARVSVPYKEEEMARKCIQDIAAEKGKKTNVKVISMMFNSPRD